MGQGKPVILHVLPSFDVGGLGSLALTMIRSAPHMLGVDHIAVAPRYQSTRPVLRPVFEEACGQGNVAEVVRDLRVPPRYVAALAATLRRVLNGREVHGCIHYNHTDLSWSIQAIRQVFSGPVVAHIGTRLDPKNADATGPFRSPFMRGVVFVPPSLAVRDAAVECIESVKSTVTLAPVVWNGVDRAEFVNDGPPDSGSFDKFIFGFTGRMAPNAKAWDFLFDAARACEALLAEDGHVGAMPFEIRVAGDGPLRAELERKAPKTVSFIGETLDVPLFLNGLDGYFMAALPIEGMSMALIEAIVARLPILSTDVASTREALGVTEAPDVHGNSRGPGGIVALRPEGAARIMRNFVRGTLALTRDDALGPVEDDWLCDLDAIAEWAKRFDAHDMARRYAEFGGWL